MLGFARESRTSCGFPKGFTPEMMILGFAMESTMSAISLAVTLLDGTANRTSRSVSPVVLSSINRMVEIALLPSPGDAAAVDV
jgi:hypothetical protein